MTWIDTVLEIDDLHTEFRLRDAKVRAVDGISFAIGEGECVGMVGESGCGKSTVGFSIMRLLPGNGRIASGSVRLLGRDLAPLTERQMQRVRGNEVALIPQEPMTSLNPTMTIGRQIAEGVRLHRKVGRAEARARALEVLRLVEMPRPEERLGQYPHELSGGLRQRVMIAMALACEPRLLIADEPTTALDVTIQAQILDLIDGLRQRAQHGGPAHHPRHGRDRRSDRPGRGHVRGQDRPRRPGPANCSSAMRHPYSEALLASVPNLEQDPSVRLVHIPGLPPDLSQPITSCRFAPRCRYATDLCRSEEPGLDRGRHARAPHTASHASIRSNDPSRRSGRPRSPRPRRRRCPASLERSRAELVRVEDMVKEFPVLAGAVFRRTVGQIHAVSDVSLTIKKGETFGLVGESGCGKTTVGRLMVGLERPTAGHVFFEGADIHTLQGAQARRAAGGTTR